ncbi:putative 3-hydroxyacyl- dehydrogenase protein [Phaeoacremonium minimum UCRPA7]|uniref:Putative 3-hydroxyacyl-dehydrogenase protein n=1 Tax=Phaeoacremonium minimum (strain UCR-PA7) TaxID=1286976 RepID=R8B9K0_PHAM7|nr:putative 3-hydroxyacyl- dehydrogenase protein [Phaeoacremonium minimum UCRPA7]EON95962.1 putative 3-hydroxyacyl- dehydrogenase protein [Phaeoacremonium minimum UCRPA7]
MKIIDRTFIISGGASGLGRACAVDIAKHGGNVAILDMNEDAGQALVKELGAVAKFWVTDVLETDSVAAAVQGAVEWIKHTGKALGGIVPAAGVGHPGLILDRKGKPFSLAHVDFVLGINVRGTLDVARQALPHLAATPPSEPDGERGVVVMVASAAAFDGQMGQVSYAASKGAVASMTLPMARDLSRFGIRVVTIAPGTFETPMTSMMNEKTRKSLQKAMEFPQREGKPEEFAITARRSIKNAQ